MSRKYLGMAAGDATVVDGHGWLLVTTEDEAILINANEIAVSLTF